MFTDYWNSVGITDVNTQNCCSQRNNWSPIRLSGVKAKGWRLTPQLSLRSVLSGPKLAYLPLQCE